MKKAHILEETRSTNKFGGIGNQKDITKKNPSTMSRPNQGTRHERTNELVILKPKQDSPNKNMVMQARWCQTTPMLAPATFTGMPQNFPSTD
jgi:hypothetical protein